MQTVEGPTHYRIYVYGNAAPPLGRPRPISLCLRGRKSLVTLRGDVSQVTCADCLEFIHQLGLDRD